MGNRISVLFFCAAMALPVAPARADDDLRAKVDAVAKPLVDNEWTMGLVVGVVDSKGSNVFAYGTTAAVNGKPIDGKTLFEIGSITKTFTCILLADAVVGGKMRLEDPVQKYLPNTVKLPKCGAREMTLLDLATHTSGLPRMPDNFKPRNWANPYADYSVEQMYEFLNGRTQPSLLGAFAKAFAKPGDPKYEYSNLAMGLLGHLIARHAKTPYETLVVRKICDPIGMPGTRIKLSPELQQRFATAHDSDGAPVLAWDLDSLAGAGALRSCADDMLKYLAANLGLVKTPLAPALEASHKVQRKVNDNISMALGWHVLKDGLITHSGGTGGFRSFAAFDKSQKFGVVILANSSVGGQSPLLDLAGVALINALEGKPTPPYTVRKIAKIDPKLFADYAGTYDLVPVLARFTVTTENGKLHAQLTGQQKFRLFPESSSKFHYKVTDAQITFERDDKGKVHRLILHQNGQDRPAKRTSAEAPAKKAG